MLTHFCECSPQALCQYSYSWAATPAQIAGSNVGCWQPSQHPVPFLWLLGVAVTLLRIKRGGVVSDADLSGGLALSYDIRTLQTVRKNYLIVAAPINSLWSDQCAKLRWVITTLHLLIC